jgi:uncharacterized protein
MSSAHGRFGWNELMTADPAAAGRFYSGLTGWTTAPFDADYTLWANRGTPIAGLMALTPEMRTQHVPPNWLSYVAVDDLAAGIDRARGMGASVVVPTQTVPNMGAFAVLMDPQGAAFGLLRQDRPGGHDGQPAVGEFSWHELATTDGRAAWNFYHTLFGWDPSEEMDMGPMGIYKIFSRNGIQVGAIYNKPPEMPAPPNWLPYIKVASVDRTVERVRSSGGTVLNGPMDVPGGGRIANLMDPQGVMISVHSNAPAAAAPKPAAKPAAKKAAPKKKAAAKPKKKAAAKQKKKAAAKAKAKPKKKAAARAKPKKKTAKKVARKAGKKAARKAAKKAAKKAKKAAKKGGKKKGGKKKR